MCCYRYTHRQCLFLVCILFMLECIFNTIYYKDVTAVYKRETNHHSNISEINNKTEEKFQQFIEICSSITTCISAAQNIEKNQIIVNSTLQGDTTKPIVVNYKNPLFNSTKVSMELYYKTIARGTASRVVISKTDNNVNHETIHYKYQLTCGREVEMDYENAYNSSYDWFMRMKFQFKQLGDIEKPSYSKQTPMCIINETSLGQIKVVKNETNLEWVEEQNPDVKPGGYYAPTHCRAKHRVAIIVPYRDRQVNLGIFLRYLHPLLKKQLLEYRIFVIEQYGTEKFNKGTLYNIAFLETQRFGKWNCLIFHDVDLVPEDKRISYSCSDRPTHMAAAVESFGYIVPYRLIFGGVTALTPQDYRTVNGYSNFYWNWGAEDDDFYARLEANNLLVSRYDKAIARYATLPHTSSAVGNERHLLLMLAKIRCRKEGLATTKYKLLEVTKEKLYTHILADVNPTKLKLDMKSVMQRAIRLHGNTILYGRREFRLSNPSKL